MGSERGGAVVGVVVVIVVVVFCVTSPRILFVTMYTPFTQSIRVLDVAS